MRKRGQIKSNGLGREGRQKGKREGKRKLKEEKKQGRMKGEEKRGKGVNIKAFREKKENE